MIVISSAYVIAAAAAAQPLSYPRILWDNLLFSLLAENLTASSAGADAPADNVLRPNTDEFWSPTAMPATLVVDLLAARDIDAVGIVHDFGSKSVAVTVESSTDSAFGSPTTLGSLAPGDDTPLLFLTDAVTHRFVRFTLTGGSELPCIPVIYIGEAMPMEKHILGPYRPINRARKTILTHSLSRGGQFLGQHFRRHGVESRAAFKFLSADWCANTFDPFAKHARSLPYFFAWNPQEFPNDVGYVWTPEDITPQYSGFSDYMDVAWTMQGIGNS